MNQEIFNQFSQSITNLEKVVDSFLRSQAVQDLARPTILDQVQALETEIQAAIQDVRAMEAYCGAMAFHLASLEDKLFEIQTEHLENSLKGEV